jgi:hypothetical protein
LIAILSAYIGKWFQILVGSLPCRKEIKTKRETGTCSKGNVQLIVFSILSMVTDLMLIALPLPQLIKMRQPLMAKIRLIVLFSVGLTIVAVTLTRLLMNLVFLHRMGQSHNVANVEIFFAAFVANAPTIYGLLQIEARNRTRPEHSVQIPDSWNGSKSGIGQPRALNVSSNALHGNESDEQLVVCTLPFYCVLIGKRLAHIAQIGIIGNLQKSAFSD